MLLSLFTSLVLSLVRLACLSGGTVFAASQYLAPNPFASAREKRNLIYSPTNLTVDLGYEIYQGVANTTTKLNTWKGIRVAAPPTGNLRWQAPQPPTLNRTGVIRANAYAPQCLQSTFSHGPAPLPGTESNEDCLFLNVYAPAGAQNLPVYVWIHGGGYGLNNGRQDFSSLVNTNNNTFIAVGIQYRLGAFGFLSSDELSRNGVVNAGLLDQHFALQWVHEYIGQFGGNASQVTISGESAGGGSVMLQAMAYGGTIGTSLFRNIHAASPYLPMQYQYKDWIPSQAYYAFATHAGCPPNLAYGGTDNPQTIFHCLQSQSAETLQNASSLVSSSGVYGTWAFLPVTDNVFVQELPSQQYLEKRVNGLHALIGNNANEGPLFTPQNITTEDALLSWLRLSFPLFSSSDISKILLYYPSTNASVDPSLPDFATNGISAPTALNQSTVSTGQQQRADNIYAETTFVCPSYWMAEGFSDRGRASYKYQYSVPAALHAQDVQAYFGPVDKHQEPDFQRAFMSILGNFVTMDNPSISAQVANGANATNASASNPATSWPTFNIYAPYQIDLNVTGGTPFQAAPRGAPHNITELTGATNYFTLVNAYTWEGGRGFRCDFWRSVARIVPE